MAETIESPVQLFEFLDQHKLRLELSIFDLATLLGVINQALDELGPDRDTVRGVDEVSQGMIDGFWLHLEELSERIAEALKALPQFDASLLNEVVGGTVEF